MLYNYFSKIYKGC